MRKIFLYALILFMAHLYSCSKSPSGNPQITRQELRSAVEYLATPFYENGIPTLYFTTANSYTHLHLPGDKPETLNYSLHQYLTTLAYETTLEMAMGKNVDGK
ncbi:MAG: hypothetical protein KGY60_12650 [Bacteroidales bacterium]|nr:hypothetical protein [Bacteroidales bacterium]